VEPDLTALKDGCDDDEGGLVEASVVYGPGRGRVGQREALRPVPQQLSWHSVPKRGEGVDGVGSDGLQAKGEKDSPPVTIVGEMYQDATVFKDAILLVVRVCAVTLVQANVPHHEIRPSLGRDAIVGRRVIQGETVSSNIKGRALLHGVAEDPAQIIANVRPFGIFSLLLAAFRRDQELEGVVDAQLAAKIVHEGRHPMPTQRDMEAAIHGLEVAVDPVHEAGSWAWTGPRVDVCVGGLGLGTGVQCRAIGCTAYQSHVLLGCVLDHGEGLAHKESILATVTARRGRRVGVVGEKWRVVVGEKWRVIIQERPRVVAGERRMAVAPDRQSFVAHGRQRVVVAQGRKSVVAKECCDILHLGE